MTNLELAPEVEQLREIVQSFARDRISALAEEAEKNGQIPPIITRSLDELGVLSPLEASADQVLDPVALVVVAEELGAGDPGVAYEAMAGAHAALAVGQLGTPDQLKSVVSGSSSPTPLGSLWCYEGYGRGPDEYCTAVALDEEHLIIDGRKIAVVRPGTADFAVLIGRDAQRTVAVLLNRDELRQCTIARDDRKVGKLGCKAAHTGNVHLADIRLPASALLAAADELAVDRLVASARLSMAAAAVGAGTAALRYSAQYAVTRQAFGQSISSYQGVSFPLAEAEMDLRGARAAILDLALRLGATVDPVELARETGQVVAAAISAAQLATVTGINTLGGHGFLTDYPVERWYRAVGTLSAIDSDPLLFG
jgi:alkylation response protein AidB-like acyl-CoA dehydrogenase